MWGFISNILQNKQMMFVLLGAALVILFGLLMHTCEKNGDLKDQIENQKKQYENNIKALNDSLEVKENKIGEKTSSIRALKTNKENLENLNSDLREMVDNQRGEILSLISMISTIDVGGNGLDTKNTLKKLSDDYNLNNIINKNRIENNYSEFRSRSAPNRKDIFGHYSLGFQSRLKEKGLKIELDGNSRFYINPNGVQPDSTVFNRFNVEFGLKTGFRNLNGEYQVYVTPINDNVSISKLEGVQMVPKDHYVNNDNNDYDIFTVSAGTTFGYDIVNNRFANVTGIHVGINIFSF